MQYLVHTKLIATTLLATTLLIGCGGKIKRLTPTELDHYYALRIWWYGDKAVDKAYLKNKTREERDAWLKENGYWDRFYQYDEQRRAEIVAGLVGKGWTYDQVYMAWGQPHERQMAAGRHAERSELYTYRFEVDYEGVPHVWVPNSKLTREAIELFRLDLFIDDGIVTEMIRRDDW